jgi:transcriptional regulator with XRE-family HTH domain
MVWDGEKLNSLMHARGLTQYTLADAVVATQPAVSAWVNGRPPSEPNVRALGRVLGLGTTAAELRPLFSRHGQASVLMQSAIFRHGNGLGRQILDAGVPPDELADWCRERGIDYVGAREAANAEYMARHGNGRT